MRAITGPDGDFSEYVRGIAQARYAIRKVFRIVDEQARRAGIDPLEHQALLQVYGAGGQMLPVNALGNRLDIPAALASRTATSLQRRGYVERVASTSDRRVTEIHITASGRQLIREIDRQVRRSVGYFSQGLTSSERWAALRILAFYVGLDVDMETVRSHTTEPLASEG